ncbi:MAG: hypothetical protein ACHQNA_06065 [Acidimicrobiales bacterium]
MGPLIVKRWKVLGLAGLAGVAATGVVIVRAERRRQALTPDDVRARLHQRYEAADPGAAMGAAAAVMTAGPPPTGRRSRFCVIRRRGKGRGKARRAP